MFESFMLYKQVCYDISNAVDTTVSTSSCEPAESNRLI